MSNRDYTQVRANIDNIVAEELGRPFGLDAADTYIWERRACEMIANSQQQIKELENRTAKLIEALAFARSVIKCGESWTEVCDNIIGGALGLGDS